MREKQDDACWKQRPGTRVEFFEKYRLQNVGATRSRLAELITIFESQRHTMTIRELEELREEIDMLTDRLRDEREA
jgi:hypothetical protein